MRQQDSNHNKAWLSKARKTQQRLCDLHFQQGTLGLGERMDTGILSGCKEVGRQRGLQSRPAVIRKWWQSTSGGVLESLSVHKGKYLPTYPAACFSLIFDCVMNILMVVPRDYLISIQSYDILLLQPCVGVRPANLDVFSTATMCSKKLNPTEV